MNIGLAGHFLAHGNRVADRDGITDEQEAGQLRVVGDDRHRGIGFRGLGRGFGGGLFVRRLRVEKLRGEETGGDEQGEEESFHGNQFGQRRCLS